MYAAHQAHIMQARHEAGDVLDAWNSRPAGTGYRICRGDTSDCANLDDFTAGTDGDLQSFTIDGKAIKDRIANNGVAPKEAKGIRMQVLSAYRSIKTDELWVTARASAGGTAIAFVPPTAEVHGRLGGDQDRPVAFVFKIGK